MEQKEIKQVYEKSEFTPDQVKQLQKKGLINRQGKITSQSISVLACQEADKLYQEISIYYPDAMPLVSRYAERFMNEQNFPALLSLVRETYELADLEEPDYMKDFCGQSTVTATFLQELTEDWIDSAFQDMN